ncbi:MAG: ProQ/FinO family protein [Candidatus Competibacteraceae bacterium]|nr:ProQ/FinO family protein [Candidatus Competibacteraceae bacterium]
MTIITENTQIDSTLTAESRGAQTQALQSRLAATYPKVFTNDAPLPLKIGIHHDLLTRHPDLDPATLRRALKRYCERRKYQLALASEGAVRVDLDGQPTGEVLEDQRKFAKLKLNNWKSTKPAKSSDQATQAPTPAPTPPPPPEQPQTAVSGRPILKLKKPGTVVAAVVVTRRAKP